MEEEINETEETSIVAEELMTLYDQLGNINTSLIDIAKSLRVISKRPNLEEEPFEEFEEEEE